MAGQPQVFVLSVMGKFLPHSEVDMVRATDDLTSRVSQTKTPSGRRAARPRRATSPPLRWAVADIIRTTLGPKSMLKMLLDAQGGIVLTNDGNAILREIDVAHPAAKVRAGVCEPDLWRAICGERSQMRHTL
eukprot:856782-Prorocentrum_minimum.AAC.4